MTVAPNVIHVAELARRNGWRAEPFGSSAQGVPLLAWWPTTPTPTRIVWAAIHGEEVVTLQALHQALRTIHADDACAVVVPVVNPDGVLLGTRQNARGVDLNRNFDSAAWRPDPSPTFWPSANTRRAEFRTQISSPGERAGSEPETQALCRLIEAIQPELAIDFHTPLECVIALAEPALPFAEHLAEVAGLKIVRELDDPTPGDSASWCIEHGVVPVTYEFELAPLPIVWSRHRDAVTRAIVERRPDRS